MRVGASRLRYIHTYMYIHSTVHSRWPERASEPDEEGRENKLSSLSSDVTSAAPALFLPHAGYQHILLQRKIHE